MQIIDINGEKRECVEIAPDKDYPGFLKIKYVSRYRQNHMYYEWYQKEDFVKNNPKLMQFAQNVDSWQEDLGVVSKGDKKTLRDNKKNWQKNIFAGYPVWIARGKGEGQLRNILKNTHNTLYIDKEWNVIPDKTSQYVISHNIHNPQAMGNTLPQYDIPKGIKISQRKTKKPKLKVQKN